MNIVKRYRVKKAKEELDKAVNQVNMYRKNEGIGFERNYHRLINDRFYAKLVEKADRKVQELNNLLK